MLSDVPFKEVKDRPSDPFSTHRRFAYDTLSSVFNRSQISSNRSQMSSNRSHASSLWSGVKSVGTAYSTCIDYNCSSLLNGWMANGWIDDDEHTFPPIYALENDARKATPSKASPPKASPISIRGANPGIGAGFAGDIGKDMEDEDPFTDASNWQRYIADPAMFERHPAHRFPPGEVNLSIVQFLPSED